VSQLESEAASASPTWPGRLLAGTGLLALIALGSAVHGFDDGETTLGGSRYLALVLVGGLVFTVVGFWLLLAGALTRSDVRGRTKLMLLGGVLAIFLAAGAVLLLPPYHQYTPPGRGFCNHYASWYTRHHIDYEKTCGPGGVVTAGPAQAGGAGGRGNKTAALVLAAGASLLTLIIAVVAVVGALRNRIRNQGSATTQAGVLHAVDESLEDLHRERDVRRAIVACYSRMEGALARSGTPRQPHEAPLEFLARVLERVAREPGHSLTDLFERAKFSAEPMGTLEKDHAIAALEALRAGLA
jgi:Domain of unknown function (DUF4129)